MIVETTRFGQITVDRDRVVSFPSGLLGFAGYKRFVLVQPAPDSYFYWMQSTEAPDLAFVVTDPTLFVPSYRIPFKLEQMQALGMDSPDQAQVLVIVNKRGNLLTGNLQGPLVMNPATQIGEQLVLSDRRFTTRVPLIELPTGVAAAASA